VVKIFGGSAPLYGRILKENGRIPSTLGEKMALARRRSLHFYCFGSRISKKTPPLIV